MPRKNNTVSDNDRERVIAAYESQKSSSEISQILDINRTTVIEIIKKYLSTGIIHAQRRGSLPSSKLSMEQKLVIKSWVDADCALSLKTLADKVMDEFSISVSKSTINRILDNFNYSLKKIHLLPERRNATDNIQVRKEYALQFSALPSIYSEDQIVFIDEVGFNVSMRTSRGRSPAVTVVPCIRSRNISICCAMNRNGIIYFKVNNRAFNGENFIDYINELKPKLQEAGILNAKLIMDNVRFHRMANVQTVIAEHGLTAMYLPPYSPFLNPIENMFSKWKEITKRSNPRNEDELMSAIFNGSELVTSEDCAGYFRNMWSYIPRCLNEEEIYD